MTISNMTSSLTVRAKNVEKGETGQAVYTGPLSERFLSLLLGCETERLAEIAKANHIEPIVKTKSSTGILSVYYDLEAFPKIVSGLQTWYTTNPDESPFGNWLKEVDATQQTFSIAYPDGSTVIYTKT